MFRRFLQSPSDLPCSAPPWGQLTAVDMVEGKIRWQVPLGSMKDFGGAHHSIPPGSISLGGPIVTAGGIVFIAGTTDSYIRAFDVETGKELWKAQLPASGNATPMTYRLRSEGTPRLRKNDWVMHSWPSHCPRPSPLLSLVHVVMHGEDFVGRVFVRVDVDHPTEDHR